MIPQNLRYGGGVTDTVMNPAVAVIVILAGLLIWFLPQRKAIAPFLLVSLLLPYDQVLVVAGLHFPLLRILILFGMIRVFFIKGRGKWSLFSGEFNKVDRVLILLFVTTAVAGVLLFQDTQALIYQVGEVFTGLGTYILLRCLLRDRKDAVYAIGVLAAIVVVLGGVMLFEHWTKGWNPYALLGGAKAQDFASDMMRDGRVRATASFAQPIQAGTFGAVAFPLFAGLWLTEKKRRTVAALGMFGSTLMVLAASSSTAALGYLAGVAMLCSWPIRGTMRLVRWGSVLALVVLQMFTTSPVYHLITHVHTGDSYHRYQLIDQCVSHFSSWWLIGTNANASWGWDMWDTADQYVQTADNSGLLALVLFVSVLILGFRYLSRARESATDKKGALFLWAIGSALFAQAISFLGISLWQQSIVEWYALLAVIAAVAGPQPRVAAQGVETNMDPGMAAAKLQPVYTGWKAHRPLDHQFMRDRKASLHGQRAKF